MANQVIQEVGIYIQLMYLRIKALYYSDVKFGLESTNRAGLFQVRVHDLKLTFGQRLRATEVGFEDRQDLLGHKSGRITTIIRK